MKSFASDNYAGVLPEIMQALARENQGHARSYGADDCTARATEAIRQAFGSDAPVHFVFNGTGANVLSFACAAESHQSVLCADTSHVYHDESSAPETFTGCRFFPVRTTAEGKITPEALRERIIRKGDIHYAQPALVTITQTTEYGTVYTLEEIEAISACCREHGLFLHLDGARIWNALAALGCTLKELCTDTGVDIVSMGGTKAGMMFGEAVVVLNRQLRSRIPFKHKQAMQLHSKTRFIAAQYEALLSGDTGIRACMHANRMAQLLQESLQSCAEIEITRPVQANVVFARIPAEWNEPLMAVFPFYVWREDVNEVRLMCSWDTLPSEIDAFGAQAAGLSRQR